MFIIREWIVISHYESLLILKKIEVKDRSGVYLHYVCKKSLKIFCEAMQKTPSFSWEGRRIQNIILWLFIHLSNAEKIIVQRTHSKLIYSEYSYSLFWNHCVDVSGFPHGLTKLGFFLLRRSLIFQGTSLLGYYKATMNVL